MLMASSSLHSTLGQVMEPGGHYFGGAQWHPFDHQRGYHPDPYWGGDWDAFRQEKYAYEMFRGALTKLASQKFHRPGISSSPLRERER